MAGRSWPAEFAVIAGQAERGAGRLCREAGVVAGGQARVDGVRSTHFRPDTRSAGRLYWKRMAAEEAAKKNRARENSAERNPNVPAVSTVTARTIAANDDVPVLPCYLDGCLKAWTPGQRIP